MLHTAIRGNNPTKLLTIVELALAAAKVLGNIDAEPRGISAASSWLGPEAQPATAL